MANAAPQSPTPQEIWAILQDIAKQLRSAGKTVQAQLLAEQSRLCNLYALQREPKLVREKFIGATVEKPKENETVEKPKEDEKGGDTGGCSICPKSGTVFIQVWDRVRTQVLSVHLRIGSEVRLIADQEGLKAIQSTGRVGLLLPFDLADLDFSGTGWSVQVDLGATWMEPKPMPDCWTGTHRPKQPGPR